MLLSRLISMDKSDNGTIATDDDAAAVKIFKASNVLAHLSSLKKKTTFVVIYQNSDLIFSAFIDSLHHNSAQFRSPTNSTDYSSSQLVTFHTLSATVGINEGGKGRNYELSNVLTVLCAMH